METFSPLSIGSLSVTLDVPEDIGMEPLTFSPLSIGSLSVTEVQCLLVLPEAWSFSPLSIGSLSVTIELDIIALCGDLTFQSPFYRVFECNRMKVFILLQISFLSVPFLSGL